MEYGHDNEIRPHELAKKFESQVKNAVTQKFSVVPDELRILDSENDGVYLSKKEANTLCCLVVGEKNGFLYLVTATIELDYESLADFKSDIVS